MNKRHYYWVPTTYFMQSLPFTIIMVLSTIFYKDLSLSNTDNAFYSSILILPWSLKPFITPFLENLAPKYLLTYLSQIIVGLCLILVCLSLFLEHFFWISFIALSLMAFTGSIHDICSDGTYLINLTQNQQAEFVGIRIIFYQVARLFVLSGLVVLSGVLQKFFPITVSWQFVFLLAALISIFLGSYHHFVIPKSPNDVINSNKLSDSLKPLFKEIMATPNLLIVFLFLFIFNMPEGQLLKIVPLFLLDSKAHGGLALSNVSVGIIYGGFGILAIMIGAFLSGRMAAKYHIKQVLLPLTALTVLSNVSYLLFALSNFHSFTSILVILFITQLGYGLSNGAFMTYLLFQCHDRPYQMSLYAYGTAVMALGISTAGSISGYLQTLLGYKEFFIWIIIFGLVTLYLTKLAVMKLKR